MTEYEQLLNQLHARPKASAVPTLERIRRLMAGLGNPQERLRCVHITGTNGKGSTAAYTAAVLEDAGFRTGLFTSPYLVDFRERFQVNRKLICQADFCRISKQVLSAEQRAGSVNEFEFVTAVAFCWFAEQNCDYVVLEAGMGGHIAKPVSVQALELAIARLLSRRSGDTDTNPDSKEAPEQ